MKSKTIWIYSITRKKSKRIKKEDLYEYIQQGWMVGRRIKFYR